MKHLLEEIRHNPLLWLLALVPVVLAIHVLNPEAHTLLFLLSVAAIVPLAALLSRATESVANRRYDWRFAQCHLGQSDRTAHRADRATRRAIYSREGHHSRSDRHKHFVHAGCVISARRLKSPCAGLQSQCRASSSWPALPGNDCDADP